MITEHHLFQARSLFLKYRHFLLDMDLIGLYSLRAHSDSESDYDLVVSDLSK